MPPPLLMGVPEVRGAGWKTMDLGKKEQKQNTGRKKKRKKGENGGCDLIVKM